MNKLLTNFNGGFPLTLDDIRWNDDAYRYAFNNLLNAFYTGATPNFIVSGCEVSALQSPQNGIHITEGLVYIEGELLQVDAHDVIYDGHDLYAFQKSVTYDSAGNKVFKDASSQQTYQVNGGVAVNTEVVLPAMLDVNADHLTDRIKALWTTEIDVITDYLDAILGVWTTVTPYNANDFSASAGTWNPGDINETIRYKANGKTMTIDIRMGEHGNLTTGTGDKITFKIKIPATAAASNRSNGILNCSYEDTPGNFINIPLRCWSEGSWLMIQKMDGSVFTEARLLYFEGQITIEID
jgi:hypothetical protein